MTEKRFSIKDESSIGLSSIYTDNGKVMTQLEVLDVLIKQHETIQSLKKENVQLKQQVSDIDGQLIMLDNCDNWDYDRMKHTVREIAEIIGYNGTINPKR